jgi:teichuronic acid biosynthesis glycosyltransferase TuaC
LLTLPSYMEGCPNVVLEALSSGRPVVATNVGGIPELVDNTCGRLVPSQDAAALAQGLKEVLSMDWDPNVLAAAHSRSWSDTAGELRAVIHQTLERYQASHSR